MRTVVSVVGNRPQFIKAAPLAVVLDPVTRHVLVHTGQHYDHELSQVFFDELACARPTTGSRAARAATRARWRHDGGLEPVLEAEAAGHGAGLRRHQLDAGRRAGGGQAGQPLGHVEAGLRSFDRAMPEEVNRVVADVADRSALLPQPDGGRQPGRRGHRRRRAPGRRRDGGRRPALRRRSPSERSGVLERLGVERGGFALVTVHRQSNTGSRRCRRLVDGAGGDREPSSPAPPAHPSSARGGRSAAA